MQAMVVKTIMDKVVGGQPGKVAQTLVWESQDLSSCSGSDTYALCHL